MPDEKLNPFKIAQQQLDQTAKILDLEPVLHEACAGPCGRFMFPFGQNG